jgi:hypothetical protein
MMYARNDLAVGAVIADAFTGFHLRIEFRI